MALTSAASSLGRLLVGPVESNFSPGKSIKSIGQILHVHKIFLAPNLEIPRSLVRILLIIAYRLLMMMTLHLPFSILSVNSFVSR